MATDIDYPTPAASLPDAQFAWLDDNGNGIDFSSDYTFKLTLGQPPLAAVLTKTDGITGSAPSLQSNGLWSPNITVSWDISDLAVLTPGYYQMNITATYINGKSRVLVARFKIDGPVIQ